MEEMETESEEDTDPEEIDDIDYYLALKEGRMMVNTKILAIKILNDLIDNLPVRAENLPHVIRGGKGGRATQKWAKTPPAPKL